MTVFVQDIKEKLEVIERMNVKSIEARAEITRRLAKVNRILANIILDYEGRGEAIEDERC